MDVDSTRRRRSTNLALTIIILILISVGLAIVMTSALRGAQDADTKTRKTLTYLAWTSFALMGGSIVLCVWAVIRLSRAHLPDPSADVRPAQPHTDAWAEAGRRFELDEDDEAQEDAETDDENEDWKQ
jgi:hypothetical protein